MESSQVTGVHVRGAAVGEDVIRVLRADGTAEAALDPRIDPGQLRRIYADMARSRLIDGWLETLHREGRVPLHIPGAGEEAAVVAAAAAFREEDWLLPGQRFLGGLLQRGVPLSRIVEDAFGRGRCRPGQLGSRPHRVASPSPVRGAQISQGAGVGWAARIAGDPVVTGVWFDESEVESHDFHTGMNFAAVFSAQTVFLCRSRHRQEQPRATAVETVADRCIAYGVPAVRCDGSDALAVWVAVRESVDRAAMGDGPTLVELITRRHGVGEPEPEADPLPRLRRHLELLGVWSPSDQASLEEGFTAELEVCGRAAAEAGPPDPGSLHEHVYAELPWHLVEQRRALLGER